MNEPEGHAPQRRAVRPRKQSAFVRRREVRIGAVTIGGDNPVAVQSMTNTCTRDADATIAQILRLQEYGCEMVRVAVPDMESAGALPAIKRAISIPLIADIHFDPALAQAAVEAGVDKVRLNPGNIGTPERVGPVAKLLARRGIPVRVGVNSGSVPADLKEMYATRPVKAIVETAHRYVMILQGFGVKHIVVSLKCSDVMQTVESYRRFAAQSDLPVHIGITEAGPGVTGAARSAVGIGLLLAEGIGDTLRVSLAGDVVDEVIIGREILMSLGLREGPRIIACPTCARAEFDVAALAKELMPVVMRMKKPLTVAVMGCVVNGPGEAAEADIGLFGAGGKFMLYINGEVARQGMAREEAIAALHEAIRDAEAKQ